MTTLCGRNLSWFRKHPYGCRCFIGHEHNDAHPVGRMNRFCNPTIRTVKVSSDACKNLHGDFTHATLALHGRGPCLLPSRHYVGVDPAGSGIDGGRSSLVLSFFPSIRSIQTGMQRTHRSSIGGGSNCAHNRAPGMNQATTRAQALLESKKTQAVNMRHARNVLRCARAAKTTWKKRFGAADTTNQCFGIRDGKYALAKHVETSGVWARSAGKDAFAAAAQVRKKSRPCETRTMKCTCLAARN